MTTHIDTRIWKEFSPADLRRLRHAARRALIKGGCHPDQVDEREVDKFLESRLPATLEKWLRLQPRG